MADVKWIKFMVGTFDGSSFKRIKRAKLKDGTSYRDRLTAIWFELLDLAGSKNLDGKLVDVNELELPYDGESQFEDIATMIDRPVSEVECAIVWFEKNRMIEIIDNVYCLSNWSKYQSVVSLEDVREKTRLRTIEYRKRLKEKNECDVTCDATVTSSDASRIKNKNKEDKNKNKEDNILSADNGLNAFKEIVDYLNLKCGTAFKATSEKTKSLIRARMNEKYSIADFKKVIDTKSKEWLDTDMSKFLRPETLFGTKFENYLNQKDTPKRSNTYAYTKQESEDAI